MLNNWRSLFVDRIVNQSRLSCIKREKQKRRKKKDLGVNEADFFSSIFCVIRAGIDREKVDRWNLFAVRLSIIVLREWMKSSCSSILSSLSRSMKLREIKWIREFLDKVTLEVRLKMSFLLGSSRIGRIWKGSRFLSKAEKRRTERKRI